MFCPQGSTESSPSPGRRLLITQQRRKVRVCPPPDSAQLSHWRRGHPPAILSSHTCARPSVRARVCACVWVCTSAGLQLCLRVCTHVTALSRAPEYVHECMHVHTPVYKHGYTLVHVHVCMLAYERVCLRGQAYTCLYVCSHLCTSVHPLLRVGARLCVFVSLCAFSLSGNPDGCGNSTQR